MTAPKPTEIRTTGNGAVLEVDFDDATTIRLDAEYLRVESPSAEVQGHSPDQRKLEHGKAGVIITAIAPVGRYAIRISFDDLHDTGIYRWDFLRQLYDERESRWAEYLARLEAAGLSR